MSIQSSERNCMNESAARAVDFIKRLDNSERLKLLCRLSQGECHGQLEKECSIRLPTLSQQLGVQRRGLIVPKKEGKQIFYRLRMTLSWKLWLSCIVISAADRKCENEYRLDRTCRYERRTAAKPFHLAAETLHIGMDTTTTCSSRPIKPPTSVPLIRMNWRSFPIDSSSSLTIDWLSQFLTV